MCNSSSSGNSSSHFERCSEYRPQMKGLLQRLFAKKIFQTLYYLRPWGRQGQPPLLAETSRLNPFADSWLCCSSPHACARRTGFSTLVCTGQQLFWHLSAKYFEVSRGVHEKYLSERQKVAEINHSILILLRRPNWLSAKSIAKICCMHRTSMTWDSYFSSLLHLSQESSRLLVCEVGGCLLHENHLLAPTASVRPAFQVREVPLPAL